MTYNFTLRYSRVLIFPSEHFYFFSVFYNNYTKYQIPETFQRIRLTNPGENSYSNTLNRAANITTILGGGITNSGNFKFNTGTVSMERASGTQLIQVNPGDYFNSLKILREMITRKQTGKL